ncbi:hypothetical protein FGB62_1g128 [Gracilaria domingensis]|nr:hypothetical protein FGB62_1g128 [Gracilaria domingensis]
MGKVLLLAVEAGANGLHPSGSLVVRFKDKAGARGLNSKRNDMLCGDLLCDGGERGVGLGLDGLHAEGARRKLNKLSGRVQEQNVLTKLGKVARGGKGESETDS